ncbi:efflux RND transporter periplasmic adaptor subunit [Psychrobacter aestuarii]|uniref:Efflux RND transporter periplasmic adaptor subunit n=1 Tax=Psychrobacter aestuarii TaxID=556327 RepID=A0ABN0VJ81_9GAMM|nr:efflux RND transporter periplasmic adaptor subunit [Psychrobacter aestuarii]
MSDINENDPKRAAPTHQTPDTKLPSQTSAPDTASEPSSAQPSYVETRAATDADTETQTVPPYRQTPPASNRMPPWLIPALVAVLVIGVVLGRYWGQSGQDSDAVVTDTTTTPAASTPTSDTEQTVLSVETVAPSQANIDNALSTDGTIVAKDVATVSAKVNGVALERVLVDEGSTVKAGQVLAVFDTDAMQQQVNQAEADVAEAQATLANAEADAARVLPLLDIDAISEQEADSYRTSAIRARAALAAAESRLNNQRLMVNNAQVVAPVSGVISEKTAEVGMVAGADPLFTIIKNGVLEWRADIDPKRLPQIDIGTPVKVSLPNNQSVMGKVRRIAPTADDNRQVTIYATLAPSRAARAGMYQKGALILGDERKQILPNSAIVSNDGYDYVMIIKNPTTTDGKTVGRIVQQRVEVTERRGADVVLAEPLSEDTQVVKQGGSFVSDGDLVEIVASSTQVSP